MVDESISCEGENDLGGRKLGKDARYEGQFDLGKPCLIQQENGSSSPRLSLADRLENPLNLILEQSSLDNDAISVHAILTLTKCHAQVVSVCALLVNEVELAIDIQRFDTPFVESFSCGSGLLQHDDRSAGQSCVAVREHTSARETVYKVKLEFLPLRIDVEAIEIGAKIASQDGQLCLAVRLDLRWRFVRMPLE